MIAIMGRDIICSFDWLYLPQQTNPVFPHLESPAVSISVSQQGPTIPSLLFRNQNLLVAGCHKAEPSLGEVRMREEWLQGEDANDVAGILQKAGLENCNHQVLLPHPLSSPCVSPAAALIMQ